VSRWRDVVLRGSRPPVDDVRLFWDLVYRVRANVQIGVVSDRAKAEAVELFHLASLKLDTAERVLAGASNAL
jgi:hypothetical protein